MPSYIVRFSLAESLLKPLFPFCLSGINLEERVQLCLNQTPAVKSRR